MLGALVALFHVSPRLLGQLSLPASSDRLEQMRILGFYRLCPAGVIVGGWSKPRPYSRLVEAVRRGQMEGGVEERREGGREEGRSGEDAALSGPC